MEEHKVKIETSNGNSQHVFWVIVIIILGHL